MMNTRQFVATCMLLGGIAILFCSVGALESVEAASASKVSTVWPLLGFIAGFALMAASLPASGDMDDALGELREDRMRYHVARRKTAAGRKYYCVYKRVDRRTRVYRPKRFPTKQSAQAFADRLNRERG